MLCEVGEVAVVVRGPWSGGLWSRGAMVWGAVVSGGCGLGGPWSQDRGLGGLWSQGRGLGGVVVSGLWSRGPWSWGAVVSGRLCGGLPGQLQERLSLPQNVSVRLLVALPGQFCRAVSTRLPT